MLPHLYHILFLFVNDDNINSTAMFEIYCVCTRFFVNIITFCVSGFAVNGINNVNTTSYERRFDLTSSSVGWICSSFDISAAICGVVIGKHIFVICLWKKEGQHFCSGGGSSIKARSWFVI
jgi:hypothetical protein